MKKIFILLLTTFLKVSLSYAQVPEKYPMTLSSLKDSNGVILRNRLVGIEISILKKPNDGASIKELEEIFKNPLYMEYFQIKTNDYGSAVIVIGTGKKIKGEYRNLIGTLGPYLIVQREDPLGGNSFPNFNYVSTWNPTIENHQLRKNKKRGKRKKKD